MARDHEYHRDALIGKLEVVYRRALENHHFAAATRAVEMQARLSGPAVQPEPECQLNSVAQPEGTEKTALQGFDQGDQPRCLKM